LLQRLNDDSIELIHGLKDNGQAEHLSLIVNSSRDSREVLISLLQRLVPVAEVNHIETRPCFAEIGELECFLKIRCQKNDLLEALSKLTIERPIERIIIQREISAQSLFFSKFHSFFQRFGTLSTSLSLTPVLTC
jgi:hypothetical protein